MKMVSVRRNDVRAVNKQVITNEVMITFIKNDNLKSN